MTILTRSFHYFHFYIHYICTVLFVEFQIKRVRSAHPISESETILRSDRLLGELYPLRAFGDVRYKWPLKLQKIILAPFDIDVPNGLQTPPYLTALPEVRIKTFFSARISKP